MSIIFFFAIGLGIFIFTWAIIVFISELQKSLAYDRCSKPKQESPILISKRKIILPIEDKRILLEIKNLKDDFEYFRFFTKLLSNMNFHNPEKCTYKDFTYRDVNLPSIDEKNITNPLSKERLIQKMSNELVNN